MTAVIYARYSRDNQREGSIEGQIRECTAYAEKNGITVVKHYFCDMQSNDVVNELKNRKNPPHGQMRGIFPTLKDHFTLSRLQFLIAVSIIRKTKRYVKRILCMTAI